MVKIGIVGVGGMGNAHMKNYQGIRGCKVVAGCDVAQEKLDVFSKTYGVPASGLFTDVDEMLATADIDAVSNVTPDAFHCPISLKCIAAGKHVLCEKPLAVNYAEAKRMRDAAKRKGVINMVNLSYRNSSAIHKAHKLVADGVIGRVIHLEASYLQGWLVGKHWGDWHAQNNWLWRLSTAHGSKGVLGDIGVHILDFATYPAGDVSRVMARLKTFKKAPRDRIGKYTLDANDSAVVTVELAGGAVGTIYTTRWATGHANSLRLRIFGDEGAIRIDLDESYDTLWICRGRDVDKNHWRPLKCPKTPSLYQRFVKSVRTGTNDQPDFARGAAIQKIMDACFTSD